MRKEHRIRFIAVLGLRRSVQVLMNSYPLSHRSRTGKQLWELSKCGALYLVTVVSQFHVRS